MNRWGGILWSDSRMVARVGLHACRRQVDLACRLNTLICITVACSRLKELYVACVTHKHDQEMLDCGASAELVVRKEAATWC